MSFEPCSSTELYHFKCLQLCLFISGLCPLGKSKEIQFWHGKSMESDGDLILPAFTCFWLCHRWKSNGYQGAPSLWVKWPECDADHSHPTSAEIKKAWICTFAPGYMSSSWCGALLVKHRDNFTIDGKLWKTNEKIHT
jgi:hypothetical protein